MNIRLFFKNIICLIVILFTALCLTGCRSQNKQVNENIYHVEYDTTIENYISLSDIGIDYLIPRLDSHYWDDCFQFMISSLCYNFYHLFRILVLEGKDQKIRMNTFRNKYQKIAVKVIRHARRIILSFSSAYRYKKKFLKYYQKLQN